MLKYTNVQSILNSMLLTAVICMILQWFGISLLKFFDININLHLGLVVCVSQFSIILISILTDRYIGREK